MNPGVPNRVRIISQEYSALFLLFGVAVEVAILSCVSRESVAELHLLNVTILSLGVETQGRVMSGVVKRNTPIPTRIIETDYTTVSDNQTSVLVKVFEGERGIVRDNVGFHGSIVLCAVFSGRTHVHTRAGRIYMQLAGGWSRYGRDSPILNLYSKNMHRFCQTLLSVAL